MQTQQTATSSSRGFCDGWLKIFTFLKYEEVEKSMYCKFCTAHNLQTKWNINMKYKGPNNPQIFFKGIRRFKIDGIRNHALSVNHREAANRKQMSGTLQNAISNMFNQAFNDYKKIMRAALFITQHRMATTKFQPLCEFLQSYGIKLMQNELYMTRYGYYEILKSFNELIMTTMIKKIKESRWYSIIVDESTDITNTKELIVYAKYLDTTKNTIQTRFLTLLKVYDSTALGLKQTILGIILIFIKLTS